MPNSVRENNNDIRAFAATHDLKKALDVGPGEGTYLMLLGDLIPEIDGVEIFAQNIKDFKLEERYHAIYNDDIRQFEYEPGQYDIVIFGDVLEHLPVDDAVKVFNYALARTKWVMVSVPMVHFPQGEVGGNVHEHHEIEDPQDDLIPVLPRPRYWWTYRVTGTFIYEGIPMPEPVTPAAEKEIENADVQDVHAEAA